MKVITISLLIFSLIGSLYAKSNDDFICDGLGLVMKNEEKSLSIFSMGELTNEDKKFALKSVENIKQIVKLLPKYCTHLKENPKQTHQEMRKFLNNLENKKNKILNN